MATMDIFHADAFTTLEMTAAVERNPYMPNGIGRLGLFDPMPIRTEALAVEERAGVLTLIQTSDRGAPPAQRTTELRDIRYFRVPRIAQGDTIKASEIANIREFGQESELMQVMKEVARRLDGPTGIRKNLEYTRENMRLGALQGILLDADGSVIYNFFTQFGITQATEVAFDLSNTTEGLFRAKCNALVRSMKRAGQGAFVEGVSETWAMCGDAFWDDLIKNIDVVKTYQNWEAASFLRQGTAFKQQFEFGDINWFNYRGSDDATTVGVATDKVKFFPRQAPGIFQQALAPGESIQWVNQPGKDEYVVVIPDRDRDTFVTVEDYSYPLFICTRPDVLLRGKRSS